MQTVAIALLICGINGFQSTDHGATSPPVTLPPKQYHDGFHCEAIVRLEPARIARGGTVKLECEVRCLGGGRDCYNPFLSRQYRLPAQIVICSVDGKVRLELLHRAQTSDQEKPRAWFTVQDGYGVGREFRLKIANEENDQRAAPGDSQREQVVDLPPGEYFVQAVYNHWLIAPGPALRRDIDQPQELKKSTGEPLDMDQPLAISLPVKLIVVTDDGTRPEPDKEADARCPVRLEIRPASVHAKIERETDINIRMVNQSDKIIDVYNPQLSRRLWPQQAVAVAVLDGEGTYLGDLLHQTSGSSVLPWRTHWLKLPPGGMVSSRFAFRAGKFSDATDDLMPGTYFLELRAFGHLISGHPDFAGQESRLRELVASAWNSQPAQKGTADEVEASDARVSYSQWEQTFPGTPLCKSNRVKLVILPRTGD
jgi:hypothetical protein